MYEITTYGSAMAPYYIMLALFVGSLLTATMIHEMCIRDRPVEHGGVHVVQGVFPPAYIQGVAVGEEGLAAPLLHKVRHGLGPVSYTHLIRNRAPQ